MTGKMHPTMPAMAKINPIMMRAMSKFFAFKDILAVKKRFATQTLFLQSPCWAAAESEDPLCRVSFIRNKFMRSGIIRAGKAIKKVAEKKTMVKLLNNLNFGIFQADSRLVYTH
jgi:hypothetical protein